MISKSLRLFADYNQFYLWDKSVAPDAPTDYSDQDVSNRVKVADEIVVVQPVRNMEVPVTIQISDTEPTYDREKWDHIAECSLNLPSGQLEVYECCGSSVAVLSTPPGIYRVRVLFENLGKLSDDGLDGEDAYHIFLWPGKHQSLHVEKEFKK